MESEEKILKGFDRGKDYMDIKKHLLNDINNKFDKYKNEDDLKNKKLLINQILYITIALIQLKNGSRISEACRAILKFVENEDIKNKVIVKISKSEGLKYNNKTKEKKLSKARYRKIVFPIWINKHIFKYLIKEQPSGLFVKPNLLKQRVLDYLLKYHSCNTHSLRYACINYLIYEQKRPLNEVSKFVGHTTVNQLVTYTQNKNVDKIYDLDF